MSARGISARAWSLSAGLGPNLVHQLTSGQEPKIETLETLAKAEVAKVSPRWLAFGDGKMDDTGEATLDRYPSRAAFIAGLREDRRIPQGVRDRVVERLAAVSIDANDPGWEMWARLAIQMLEEERSSNESGGMSGH